MSSEVWEDILNLYDLYKKSKKDVDELKLIVENLSIEVESLKMRMDVR